MSIKIGISPIAWQNDDLPELTKDFTMEQALLEAREIGYTGVERGQRMPHDTEGLKAYLESAKIELCGGWCSGSSLINDFSEECEAISQQVHQFVELMEFARLRKNRKTRTGCSLGAVPSSSPNLGSRVHQGRGRICNFIQFVNQINKVMTKLDTNGRCTGTILFGSYGGP